eukprot:TRINITY_DN12602_c0_g1_i1.p1 TRINITY_DN12602_c0_g1~~TRINITY_DN12602_c0_g1_i1.p1  ORF type:complete len:289 (-),score=25.50 TRINITY_DN12602_c0_g1_i1:73-939(-)
MIEPDDDNVDWAGSIPLLALHIGALAGLLIFPITLSGVLLCTSTYIVRMWSLTTFSHRYFSHRTFKTSRAFQLFMGVMSTLTVQNGILWWASNHRHHHKYTDREEDLHSPKQKGFWWSHFGWVMSRRVRTTNFDMIRDLTRFPELVWLHEHWRIPVLLSLAAFYIFGGMWAVYWGFIMGVAVFHHGTFTVNSLAHMWGTQRYNTGDTSRNNWFVAIITMGEGWHNNHHHYEGSAAQGFFWWELDVSFYVLRVMAAVGLVWDLRLPPKHVVMQQIGAKEGSVAGTAVGG